MPRPPTKAVLCLHGGGSSKDIFRVQLAGLGRRLTDEFEFIFVNAPYASPAGPGILPLFAGGEPFYRWFGAGAPMIDSRLGGINAVVRAAIEAWKKTKPESDVVGIVAFSEGGLAALLLLWQQQLGRLPWLPTLRFATLICCYFPDEAAEYMYAKHGGEGALIKVPTLHLHGRQDFCLAQGRKLVSHHCMSELAHVLEFEGGHHCPKTREDCEEAAKRMLQIARTAEG